VIFGTPRTSLLHGPNPVFQRWAALAVSFASSSFRAAVGETIYRVNREKEVLDLCLNAISL